MDLYSKCRCSTNRENDQFVGIRFDTDIEIIFPVGYEIPKNERELKSDVLLMLKTFELTDSNSKEKVETGKSYLDSFALPINSYFWLLKDYINNGLYQNREKTIRQNSNGKINWKKTIQKTQPVTSNKGFVYLEPYFELTRNTDTLITEIEKYCLQVANVFFSWLFGEIRIQNSIFGDQHISYMQSILKKELMVSFTDYKKTLIQHLLNILNGLDDDLDNSRVYSYGTYNYEVVWENLLKDIFNNVKLDEFFPKTKWNLIKLNRKIDNSSLRPDSIYYDRETGKYYILDAKYYRSYLDLREGTLPATTDIEKQITYGDEICEKEGIDPNNVYNAMIIPYNKFDNSFGLNDDIQFLGMSESSWVSGVYPYQNVQLLFMDTTYVIKHWKRSSDQEINYLIDVIERNIL